MNHAALTPVRIWDLPTRLFHWTLAALVVALVVTAKLEREDLVPWHARLGYAVAALLLFRLVWGWMGGHWSRFASFRPSVSMAWRHLRGEGGTAAGHNPLGAWAVYALLLLLAAQVVSGLFVVTLEDFAGPLSGLVSRGTARLLTGYHREIGEVAILGATALHVLAIAVYAWRGKRLVPAMWHGDRHLPADTPASRDDASTRLLALFVLMLCSGIVWAVVRLGG